MRFFHWCIKWQLKTKQTFHHGVSCNVKCMCYKGLKHAQILVYSLLTAIQNGLYLCLVNLELKNLPAVAIWVFKTHSWKTCKLSRRAVCVWKHILNLNQFFPAYSAVLNHWTPFGLYSLFSSPIHVVCYTRAIRTPDLFSCV